MAQVAIFSFLVGAVFGLRFKVFVLLPLTLAIGATTLLVAIVLSASFAESLAGFAITTFAIHGGYLFGSFTRFAIAAARATRVLARRPLKAAR